ncbi:MAG TPA: ABC transporter permease [Caproicibacter sp.]|nr:ABC transporter permease [Caproicibacter sp.]
MFSKLAFKNVTKSMKDYLVYFLTLMFGVCLFYMFNSIDAQTAMLAISKGQYDILKTLTEVISYVSVFISVILGFLVVYANGFLMKRRKKELGVYMTLGMPKSRISAIIILETFLIGLISLAAGLVAGIFLSQGMSVVTAKLFEANLTKFVFTFSKSAFWKTLVYFGVMFLIVMLFNTISVSHLKLIDLLSAGHKNQKLRINKLWMSVVIFLVSVACLGTAYYLIEKNGMIQFTPQFAASLILGVIGTLLFFLSLSGFLLRVVKSNKKLYFKNLNMFVLRQFNSKINTTFVSVSVICIMLLVTIGTLSTGMGISNALSKDLKNACPYDATVTSVLAYRNSDGTASKDGPVKQKSGDIVATLQKTGFDLSHWSRNYAQISTFDSGIQLYTFLTKQNWPEILGNYTEQAKKSPVSAVKLSEYNNLMKMVGKQTLSLQSDQYALNCNYGNLIPIYNGVLQQGKTITIDGKNLKPNSSTVVSEYFENRDGGSDTGTLILPDSFFEGKHPVETTLNLNYQTGVKEKEFRTSLKAADDKASSLAYDMVSTKNDIYETAGGYKLLVSYLALYIGLVFLIAAAAILALQQLSESSDNAERYGLLRKLGVEEKMLNHALFTQIALYFLLPLSLAIIHCIVGIDVANRVIRVMGAMDVLSSIIMTAVIFLVVYGAYFLATYFGSKSMIRQKDNFRRTE